MEVNPCPSSPEGYHGIIMCGDVNKGDGNVKNIF
jgi:hypothetical protein